MNGQIESIVVDGIKTNLTTGEQSETASHKQSKIKNRSERQIIEDKIKALESLQWMVSSEARYLGSLKAELKEIKEDE